MKRLLTIVAAALPLMAQAPAPEFAVPHSGEWLTGSVDVGYRWNTGPAGSLETYRSVVNLGAGLKLTGLDFTLTDPHHRAFDQVHVEAYDWSDPFATLRVTAEKRMLYRLTASYRSLTYFNNLPSFADPLVATGVMLSEQSFDSRRHLGSFELRLLPQRMFSPYFAVDHDANSGHGVNTFQTNDNEFAVPYQTTDVTTLYRGGVNIATRQMHATLEGGGTTFRTNQDSYATGTNPGNSSALIFGQALTLTGLAEGLGVRGNSNFIRLVFTANPFRWLDLYGHFGHAESNNTTNFAQYDTGNLIYLRQILFYSGERFLEGAVARLPHTSGDFGWQARLPKWVRLDQHWLVDRLRNTGTSTGTDSLLSPGSSTLLPINYASLLATNYNEVETGVELEVSGSIRLRGAHRYEWGDATDVVTPQVSLLTLQKTTLDRNVALGSASWRVSSRLRTSADFEWGVSSSEYYRTSLYNYKKVRLMARYDLRPNLHLTADYRVLANKNPLAGSPYKSLSSQESLSLQWVPKGQKVDFVGSWEHCAYHTYMVFLDPTYLIATNARYREDCNDFSGLINGKLPAFLKHGQVSVGGSALLTAGSRPTTYYQPTAKAAVPLGHGVSWFAVWQYYGFGESFYGYESFRTHLFTTGLRFTR